MDTAKVNEEKITCSNCNQKTPRNMYNKCIYCGTAYPEKYWFTADEKAGKLARLKEQNEEDRKQIEESRKKEKEREKRKNSDPLHHDIDGGFF